MEFFIAMTPLRIKSPDHFTTVRCLTYRNPFSMGETPTDRNNPLPPLPRPSATPAACPEPLPRLSAAFRERLAIRPRVSAAPGERPQHPPRLSTTLRERPKAFPPFNPRSPMKEGPKKQMIFFQKNFCFSENPFINLCK